MNLSLDVHRSPSSGGEKCFISSLLVCEILTQVQQGWFHASLC